MKKRRLGVLLNIGESLALYERMGQKDRLEQSYLARYARRFDEVRLFTYGDDEPRLEAVDRVQLIPKRVAGPELLYSLLMPIVRRRSFRDLSVIRSLQSIGGLPALVAKRLFGVPYVTTLGFFASEHYRVERGRLWAWIGGVIERAVVRGADAVIVTTDSLKEYAMTLTTEDRIHMIPNGVELNLFDLAKRKPPFSDPTTEILFVGRLSPQKDLETLLRAASMLDFDYRITVIGEGERRRALERLAGDLKVAVEFIGAVPNRELPRYYLSADLFVLPSRIEGHPKALLEAFAAALPCIGARVEGIAGLIENGKNGLLFDPGEPTELADRISSLRAEPALAERMGLEARRLVEDKFDLEKLLARELELLLGVAR